MAATSVHNDIFLDSEERHERASDCAYAFDDPLVGSFEGARCGKMAIQMTY